MLKAFLSGLVLSCAASLAQAGTINVNASGLLPSSPFNTTPEIWEFSGSFSDGLTDAFGALPGGTFEFEPADLASLSFSIGGTEIGFLTPTPGLLDSRVVVNSSGLSFSLFFDPSDPFFGGGYSSASFSIFVDGGPFAADFEDLSTLFSIAPAASTGWLFYQPTGGSFGSSFAIGTVEAAPAAVPLPASLLLLLSGLAGLAAARRRV
ncbi:VPLPA-CTERM sorting domain-containing protein [Pacificoceanicola onchidii]|uniref:VPLPA-CTERM sorting domain-containing protein n=1 Tax=Pacificoceanicola onchidii TaxID=2562685 RepID=UPI0010A636C8|nr:VPLPA-CTERM sorting domain-containing protein [Pacificoceanicola onchidii]